MRQHHLHARRRRRHGRLGPRLLLAGRLAARRRAGEQPQAGCERQKDDRWEARHKPDQRGNRCREPQCAVVLAQLKRDLSAQAVGVATAHARHHGARRDRNEQRWYLRYQAVDNGQNAVGLAGLRERHPVLQHADDKAAGEIDDDDNQAGDRITFHKFHRAIHGAIKLAFLLQRAPALPARRLIDLPAAQVRVDRHLLARHGIQAEAGGHLGDALGALRNDNELNDRDDEENHQPDHDVAGDHELAEGADDLARVGLSNTNRVIAIETTGGIPSRSG